MADIPGGKWGWDVVVDRRTLITPKRALVARIRQPPTGSLEILANLTESQSQRTCLRMPRQKSLETSFDDVETAFCGYVAVFLG